MNWVTLQDLAHKPRDYTQWMQLKKSYEWLEHTSSIYSGCIRTIDLSCALKLHWILTVLTHETKSEWLSPSLGGKKDSMESPKTKYLSKIYF